MSSGHISLTSGHKMTLDGLAVKINQKFKHLPFCIFVLFESVSYCLMFDILCSYGE